MSWKSSPKSASSRCSTLESITSLSMARSFFGLFYTAYLFSQSDIAPIMGPSLAVSFVLAGPPNLKQFTLGFLWVWLHLVTFEIKNQIIGLEEDKLSKPNRPIVSGRISVENAQKLYIAAMIVSVAFSIQQGLLPTSVIYMYAIYLYNEGGLARHWFLKSLLGSIGYVSYCWGSTAIFQHNQPLSGLEIVAVLMSGAIHTTTGHAQDFRDRDGDAAIGRKTLALILPQRFGRWSLSFLVLAWTGALIAYFEPPTFASILLIGLAVKAMGGFVKDWSQEADRNSYWWYNMWLISAHMLPIFPRLRQAGYDLNSFPGLYDFNLLKIQ